MKKHFIVVGGSSGIGLQLTSQLTASGHQVTVVSRSMGGLQGMEGITHITHDVMDESLPSLDAEAIDGIVYCPGTINLKPFHGLKQADFQKDFEVNVMGAIKMIQATLKPLKKAEQASIVLFSTVAVQQGMPFHSSVAASKGAIEGLTRALAAEYAPNIRVNCIAPSITDTPLASRLLASEDKKSAAGKRHALNRVGTASEVARLAQFLLTEDSSWMTGQVIGLDGGMSVIRSLG